jgi:SRSO17 transposase
VPFLRALDEIGQDYVGEVPSSFRAWTKQPEVMYREHESHRRAGRPRKFPRLKVQTNPTVEVRNILTYSPVMRREPWQTYRVKDGTKGPMVWEAKRIPVWLPDAQGLPTRAHHLLVARNVLDPTEVKYFVSNAPEETTVETLLLVALSRWRIERMFEDSKGELGMDHFEVRRYISIKRHLIVSCVSHLFLAEFWLANQGGKSGVHALPSSSRHRSARPYLAPERSLHTSARPLDQPAGG